MSILLADIYTDIRAKLNRGATEEFLEEVREACKTLSGAGDFLHATEEDTLSSGESTISYPTDYSHFKEVYVYESSDENSRPLKKSDRPISPNPSSGKPSRYDEYENTIRFNREADQDYLYCLEYFKYHSDTVTTIEFTDEFRPALYCLAAGIVARDLGGLSGKDKTFFAMYVAHLRDLKAKVKTGPNLVEYCDL